MKSRLHLPKLQPPPRTILEYLIAHFPHIQADTWSGRFGSGKVTLDDGSILNADSPYRHGVTVLYSREVAEEPEPVAEAAILFQDSDILVADKPHGVVVTPAGACVERSLLAQLQRQTGLSELAPVHRLDRETAGLVLFTIRARDRGSYHRLFSSRSVHREYLAVAKLGTMDGKEWEIRNRLEAGEPWFRRRIAGETDAAPNAITRIELVESQNGLGLFRLLPETGKKHQLRVHMASIGCPIVGDLFYPEVRQQTDSDSPLQLLAHRLAFDDPLSGEPRSFTSTRKLIWPVE